MKTKFASQSAPTPVRATPVLPWEIVAFGVSTSAEPRSIGAQAGVYRAIVALSALPRLLRTAAAKMKRAGVNPRVSVKMSDDQTDRQMYFISR